ncbi:LysR family transcriptional regulator [Lysobacter cavernae]|uniref:LysR family transcriptional regulator n=1 Tax=Lysobacter cavernae TaxID=1685901 RepID=A0ABV7RNX6_9GAMM
MDKLQAMRAFRAVVEANGFSAAAERLDTTHSSVSRQIKQLETELGARLINRNTRNLTLTGTGERCLALFVEILDRVDHAMYAIAEEGKQPSGILRISAPLAIGTLELENWLPAFQKRYPDVRIDLSCDDRFVDLIGNRFDVALRISEPLADTSLVTRTLAVSDLVLVAAPAYITRHGLPRRASELGRHRFLNYSTRNAARELTLVPARGDSVRIAINTWLKVDTIVALHAAVMAGLGIAAFTLKTVETDLARGRLIRILPSHTLGARHYYAVYPHSRHLSLKVRAFVEHMAEHYRTSAGA